MTTDWPLLKCGVVHANAACGTAQPRAGTTPGSRQECSAVQSGQLLLSSDKRHHVSRCQFPKSQQHCREPTKDTPSLAGGAGGSQPAARPVTLRTTRHDRGEQPRLLRPSRTQRCCRGQPVRELYLPAPGPPNTFLNLPWTPANGQQDLPVQDQ